LNGATHGLRVVLLPGMDGTGLLFAPFVTALHGRCDVHTIDYPTREPLGYPALVGHALARLPPAGPLVLLGESFSGPVAVMLTQRLGSRVKGLVLCCSFVRNPRPWLAAGRPFARRLPQPPVGLVARLLFGRFLTPQRASTLKQALSALPPEVLAERLDAVVGVDVTAMFTELKMPTLYLQAAQDRLVPRSAAELVRRLRPSTRVMRFHGPHALLQALAQETAAAVVEFVREVGAPA
jgi:pimeloyl-[acyl-carrier protein] methyl ester esterase